MRKTKKETTGKTEHMNNDRRGAKKHPSARSGKRNQKEKKRRHSGGRGLFLSSLLLTVISVGALVLQNSDLQVYAEELGQAIASTVGADTTPPTLNAAVSDGYLQIVAEDQESMVDKLFVCGYEYSGLVNNALSIRLQQFDAGYQNFSIYAVDSAGNVSQEYLVPNPYYEPADGSNAGVADALPVDAGATAATSATGTVTEHTVSASTDGSSRGNSSGGTGSTGSWNGSGSSEGADDPDSRSEAKRNALQEADAYENGAIPTEAGSVGASDHEGGKEFYTIKTANDKTFYLVIDRDKSAENVHFLTDISERDLLNATQDNSATLPRNTAVTAGSMGGGLLESALPNNNPLWDMKDKGSDAPEGDVFEGISEDESEKEGAESVAREAESIRDVFGKRLFTMGLIGVGIIAIAVVIFFVKRARTKGGNDYDDDDEDYDEEDNAEEDPEVVYGADEDPVTEADPEDEADNDEEA